MTTTSGSAVEALAPKELRSALLSGGAPDREFTAAYTDGVDDWLRQVFARALLATGRRDDMGVVLLAVGGHGRAELCPGSDLDLVLVHAGAGKVADLADAIWYPVWDSGIHLDHSVRTPKELAVMVDSDVRVALGQLTSRAIAGDAALAARVRAETHKQWTARPRTSLQRLRTAVHERWEAYGELAHLVEPDIKQCQGGLRDVEALAAAALVSPVVPVDPAIVDAHARLLTVRVALHAVTGRATDVLTQQHQSDVPARGGAVARDALMVAVAGAGDRIAWVAKDGWRRLDGWLAGPARRTGVRDRPADAGIVLRDGEVAIEATADPSTDSSLALRVGAAAARHDAPIARATLERLSVEVGAPPEPWPAPTRDALVRLLGAGAAAVPVLETLVHAGVLERYLPEWSGVRSRPQHNPYHRFTVDRHLCETAAAAAAMVRDVHRPDLLLVGAWLHDVGKGQPGDHTEVGMAQVRVIGTRMGFDDADVDVLVDLVRDHLLLADAATRRDLADPATVASVVHRVGTVEQLELLAALTRADSMATGPEAWSSWKAGLLDELVDRTRARLAGRAWDTADTIPRPEHRRFMAEGRLRLLPAGNRLTVIAPDQAGLLAILAGVLALHRLPVRSAVAVTDGDMAVEEYDLDHTLLGVEPDWSVIEADVALATADPSGLDRRLATRGGPSSRRARAAGGPQLLIDNEATDRATVVEVRAPDGRGVLYRIARAIASVGHDVLSAKVLTLGDEVVDTFYLRDATTKQKILDERALGRLREAVLTELQRPW
jgi:[protein-PII] uridylyltransferase